MLTVGITGSTGSGKGYVCGIFSEYGIKSLDTDAVSRLVYEKGQPCYLDLVSHFGNGILREDGEIDRKALFNVAFSDKQSYAFLTETAYGYILGYCRRWLSEREKEGAPAAIIDAPMLFESGFDKECDLIITVASDLDTKIKRVTERDGVTRETVLRRLEKQMDDGQREALSDIVIRNGENEGESLKEQVGNAVAVIMKIAKGRRDEK